LSFFADYLIDALARGREAYCAALNGCSSGYPQPVLFPQLEHV
jgi:hypothetical protein